MNTSMKFNLGLLAVLILAGILGRAVTAGPVPADSECAQDLATADKQIAMRLETAYLFSPRLNNLSIDTRVKNGDVTLSGTVVPILTGTSRKK